MTDKISTYNKKRMLLKLAYGLVPGSDEAVLSAIDLHNLFVALRVGAVGSDPRLKIEGASEADINRVWKFYGDRAIAYDA